MRRIVRGAALLALALGAGVATIYAYDDSQTVKELVERISGKSATPPGGADSKSNPPAPTPETCPEPAALELFKYRIIFEGTEEAGTLKGLAVIHTDVWERGNSTAFYVRERPLEFSTDFRMVYLFDKEAMDGGGCPAEQNWVECVEKFDRLAETESIGSVVRTCTTTIDIRSLPAWKPSADSPEKRRVADELRAEIEAEWRAARKIVIRDFDLRDPEITMYLETPGDVEYHGCSFYSRRQPHCEGWHLFGQSPLSGIRKWILDKPYRLK